MIEHEAEGASSGAGFAVARRARSGVRVNRHIVVRMSEGETQRLRPRHDLRWKPLLGTNVDQALDIAYRVAQVVLQSVRQPVDGIILHGSLASGGYEPQRSDIDLLVVAAEPLQPAAKHTVFSAVRALLAPVPAAIDLRITSRATAATPPRLPTIDLEVAAHLPDNVLQIVADSATDPDLLNEFAICRAHGRSLHGRSAAEMIGPVPREWLLEIADDQLAAWQRVHATGHVGPIVPLTACRIWRYAIEGAFCSKHDAGRWAFQRAPECGVIVEALRAHEGERGPQLDGSTLPQLLTHVREAVAEARQVPTEG